MLLKRPGTTSLAIAALSVGIGLTTTMFSIVDAAFLRGLPFDHGGDIVDISRRNVVSHRARGPPIDDYLDWRDAQHSFSELGASSPMRANIASAGELPERNRGAYITTNTLHLLRVRPALGRDFAEGDARPGAPPVALIS